VALFRNVVGVAPPGPSCRCWWRSLPGLALVAFVLAIGVGTRLALERLRLLMVPRLAIMLCMVVLSVAGLSLVGDAFGAGTSSPACCSRS
jgi:hypothetical protein